MSEWMVVLAFFVQSGLCWWIGYDEGAKAEREKIYGVKEWIEKAR